MTYSTVVNGFSGRPGMDASADAGRDYSQFSGRGRWGIVLTALSPSLFSLLHCKQTQYCGTNFQCIRQTITRLHLGAMLWLRLLLSKQAQMWPVYLAWQVIRHHATTSFAAIAKFSQCV